MPKIAEFDGITISIFYRPREHPPPHFHATCGDSRASYDIDTLRVRAGRLPRRQHKTVLEWAMAHKNQLVECWNKAAAGEQPGVIS